MIAVDEKAASVRATCRSCPVDTVAESRAVLDDAGWMFDDDVTCSNFDLTGFCPECVTRDAGN